MSVAGEVPGEIRMAQDSIEAFQQGYIYGAVTVYCEQVSTGAKLAGEICVPKRHVSMVKQTVKTWGCSVLCAEHEERVTVWIYKYPFVKFLIEALFFSKTEGKPTAAEIWAAGKVFGYSDFEIAKYLEQHGFIANAIK